MRTWRKVSLFYAGLIFLTISGTFLLHRREKNEIRPPNQIKTAEKELKNLPENLRYKIGAFDNDTKRASRFFNFDPNVPDEDVFRIGAFGDSFTWGSEAHGDLDYPHFLQKILKKHGYKNVEVLNFGSSWHGFHQSYIIWKFLGEKYGIDLVLLGPGTLYPRRDVTFNHAQPYESAYIHSRFIVENGKLNRLDPVGDSVEERFEEYYSFIPHIKYLKYDRYPYQAIYSELLNGHILPNYFYYTKKSIWDEAVGTYKKLLEKMSREVPVFALLSKNKMVEELKSVQNSQFFIRKFVDKKQYFPYRIIAHNSGNGNYDLAKSYFHYLTDEAGGTREKISYAKEIPRAVGQKNYGSQKTRARSLDEIESVDFVLNKNEGGKFVSAECCYAKYEGIKQESDRGVKSYIALKLKNRSLAEAIFFPLSFIPQAGERVVLRGDEGEIQWGKVRSLSHHAPFFYATVGRGGFETLRFPNGERALAYNFWAMSLKGDAQNYSLFIGDEKLDTLMSDSSKNKIFMSMSSIERAIKIGAEHRFYVPLRELPREGELLMRIRLKGELKEDIPLATWKKKEVKFPKQIEQAPFQLVKAGEGTKLAFPAKERGE